jgi:predicted nucleotidyltransferase
MPVRPLSSAVLVWPDAKVVDEAARRWAEDLRRAEASVVAVGYFGSYARGDWGVGSDLDVVIVVDNSPEPFERRAARFDATGLPVPVDLLVYTREEWVNLATRPKGVVWMSGSPA